MAAFAIVAKGDMKKAITRIQNWTRVERQHRLSEISEEEVTVWMQKKCALEFLVRCWRCGRVRDCARVRPLRAALLADVTTSIEELGQTSKT
eukprot:2235553-Rhodomonas_salina.5